MAKEVVEKWSTRYNHNHSYIINFISVIKTIWVTRLKELMHAVGYLCRAKKSY